MGSNQDANGRARERGGIRPALFAVAAAVVALTALLGTARQPAGAIAAFVVNTTGDGVDIAPGNGVCLTATPGECTLRAAIMEANALAGTDNIFFAIPGGGVHTITPGSPLPSITPGAVTIDGTTQGAFVAGSSIEISGASAGAGANGIALVSSSNTVKGLTINRFGFAGVHVALGSTGNTILRNTIGTNAAGAAGIGNGAGVALYGDTNTVGEIGGEGNLISGNINSGIMIDGSSGNAVRANKIGTNATATAALPNAYGILLTNGATLTAIGIDYPSERRNIISGNTLYGIWLNGASTTNNFVLGNAVGTDGAGTGPIGNGIGVLITGAPANAIGCGAGCGTSPDWGNVISGNAGAGVQITNGATGVLIQANRIGLNYAGSTSIPNGGAGVVVDGGANANSIGGAGGVLDRNYISGNGSNGVLITGAGTNGNLVYGDYIGTNAAGTAGILNSGAGVRIRGGASGNYVGNGTAAGRNLISGNLLAGVRMEDTGTNSNHVLGNYIGTDATGTAVIASFGCGVLIAGDDANEVASNLISGNSSGNACVFFPATHTVVTANLIGTNATATGVLANPSYGVWVLNEQSRTIAITNNTIGGNTIGLYASASAAGLASSVSGNAIGTDQAGVASLPNGGDGVRLDGASYDWPLVLNKIANNGGNGVTVNDLGTSRVFLGNNEIHDNGALGIDLGNDGVTANDAKDPDAGPNFLQNRPTLISANDDGGGATNVTFTLNSRPNRVYGISIFASPACDPSGFGEGATSIGIGVVGTDGNGDASGASSASPAPVGSKITAVASDITDPSDAFYVGSSEFSNCVTVAAACAGDTDCDGVLDAAPDNCLYYGNPSQANSDSGPPPPAGRTGQIDNGSGIATPDTSIPNGDGEGDPCDGDRDNDGLADYQDSEPLTAYGSCSTFAGASDGHSNPGYGDNTDVDLNGPSWDTDNDGVRDGVECALGKNPRNGTPGNKPSKVQCANYHTGGVGPNTDLTDLDNDGLPAYDEYCKWGTEDDPAWLGAAFAQDLDGDAKKDCVEANDTDGNGISNYTGDTINSAKAANNLIQKTLDFDLDGNGNVNFTGDTILAAKIALHVGGICL